MDDLELHAVADAGLIEARSIWRLGDSDLGVNARRLMSKSWAQARPELLAVNPERGPKPRRQTR